MPKKRPLTNKKIHQQKQQETGVAGKVAKRGHMKTADTQDRKPQQIQCLTMSVNARKAANHKQEVTTQKQ